MKRNMISLILGLVLLLNTPSVFAEEVTPSPKVTGRFYEQRQEMKEKRENLIEQRKEAVEELKEKKKNLMEQIKEKISKTLLFGARINGELTAINGNTLMVKKEDGNSYTINVTTDTQLRRRFGGKGELAEFAVGNKVNVVGKWTDENKTSINAKLVRNISVQKLFAAFIGKVTTKNADNFVMETENRGNQTVVFGSAKFINRKEEVITYDNLQVGQRVRVKGMWDKSTNKIMEVKEVKNFDLPEKVKRTPSPTVS